ncbi:MAG TPA: YidC/Oxa1 family membrane protein insertase [Baekduia sp.]|uniref:YidC/Oxa1 family membrane protein insertase n=1 Tax=Baekduia sp. TaxID=2600305 RepID=UPI002D777CA3|nr:YidC/Oxa1 family membrane protein insertase [Baekduia sp.]HET6508811.1 YidC/Oxa1 family membrane protein insertase [Baekduia sp.]
MVPITANILQPLVDVFETVLKFFHDTVGASWGLSIILLTIVVRALLLPLAVKQFRSMQALQRIAPHLKVLQEKYKDDKQRLQQETMKFYQEHKVNPFASCLPLVAQLPVFLSLFYMLRKDLRHDICPAINPESVANPKPCGHSPDSEFWFIHDITDKATGSVLVILIVLYVGSQLVSSLLMMTATADKNQKTIMLLLPFFFVAFVFRFPAGLILYWITTNIWTIGQQQFLRRVIGRNAPEPPPLPEATGGGGKKGGTATATPAAQGAGGGGFLARLQGAAQGGGGATNGSASGNGGQDESRVTKAPPPPPRSRKKKRSGRRR